MAELNVSVVAVDRKLWTGTANMVSAMTLEGDIGIMPRHEPVLALLANSPVRIHCTDGDLVTVAVHGGFFAVDSDNVSILAESAELKSEIDVARARDALARARTAGTEHPEVVAAMARAATRIKVATGEDVQLDL